MTSNEHEGAARILKAYRRTRRSPRNNDTIGKTGLACQLEPFRDAIELSIEADKGQIDVVHVHWPDLIVTDRNPIEAALGLAQGLRRRSS